MSAPLPKDHVSRDAVCRPWAAHYWDLRLLLLPSLTRLTIAAHNTTGSTPRCGIEPCDYDDEVRQQLKDAIERIVRAECQASGSPQEPTFEYYEQYPLTDNDPEITAKVHASFEAHFDPERVKQLDRQTASEDFSHLPVAFGIPYTYWGFGGTRPHALTRDRRQ
jgi:metal-dependent amidase/aminoacylase/carboxypeptidase family protein